MKTHSWLIMRTKHCEIRPFCLGLASLFYHVNWLHYTTKEILLILTSLSACLPPFPSLCVPLCLSCWISSVFLSCCGGTKRTKEREETVSFSSTVVSGGVQLSTVLSAGQTGWIGGTLRTRPEDCWAPQSQDMIKKRISGGNYVWGKEEKIVNILICIMGKGSLSERQR